MGGAETPAPLCPWPPATRLTTAFLLLLPARYCHPMSGRHAVRSEGARDKHLKILVRSPPSCLPLPGWVVWHVRGRRTRSKAACLCLNQEHRKHFLRKFCLFLSSFYFSILLLLLHICSSPPGLAGSSPRLSSPFPSSSFSHALRTVIAFMPSLY